MRGGKRPRCKTKCCMTRVGGRRCQRVDESGERCRRSAQGKTDFCITHGGGRRCQHVDEGGEPCRRGARCKTDFCITHGGGRRCQHVDEGGKPCGRGADGKTSFCKAHGGGMRCQHVDAHILDVVAPCARYRGEGIRLCWGCFAALHPLLAKLKVRKEHYVLAELQRQVSQLSTARVVVWDCPVPGGCSLKQPDHLFAWEERYLQVEVDEEGHAGKDCEEEDARLEIIAADLGRPGLVVRINPDHPPCFSAGQLRNGEKAFRANKRFAPMMERVARDVRGWLARPIVEDQVTRFFYDGEVRGTSLRRTEKTPEPSRPHRKRRACGAKKGSGARLVGV